MKNQVFIPTVAEFAGDISKSREIQKPLIDAGYSPGLMIVARNGRKGVTLDSTVQEQYSNLEKIKEQYKNSPVVGSVKPTGDGLTKN